MANPNPLPTTLKKMRGTYRKDRAATNEAKPPVSRPSPPRWLSKYARSEWRYITPKLDAVGLLTKIDRGELAAYCEAFGKFREATEALQREGNEMVVQTHNGNYVQSPWVSIQNKAAEAMHKYAQQFGMTPSSRTRINVEKPEEDESLVDVLYREALG